MQFNDGSNLQKNKSLTVHSDNHYDHHFHSCEIYKPQQLSRTHIVCVCEMQNENED